MVAETVQARCDRLYEMHTSSRWAGLAGQRSHEVAALLGAPDEVMTLDHAGATWTRIVYRCEMLPAGAPAGERVAYGRGWRFAPTLLLRDGVVVPADSLDRAVGAAGRTAGPPPGLVFRPGGTFP